MNKLKIWAALLLSSVLLTVGCNDSLLAPERENLRDISEETVTATTPEAKFRHAHLLDRATRASGKDGDQVGLIFALETQKVLDRYKILDRYSVLDRYKVLERYKAIERYKVLERYDYENVFPGFAIWVDAEQAEALIAEMVADPEVAWVEPDIRMVRKDPVPPATETKGSQMLPWGVERIGAYRLGIDVRDINLFIIDTGVENGDLEFEEQVDFTGDTSGLRDKDGHGTHIAGIAGAKDDGDGIVGTAPKVRLHSLRVLTGDEVDTLDEVDLSAAIAAVEHVTTLKIQEPSMPIVVNFSLGADTGTPQYNALDDAIQSSIRFGVTYVIAAGNDGIDVETFSPAHVEEAITVAAYDREDRFAAFSNFGAGVDILAPGVDVLSLTNGNDQKMLKELSGTSMAAAHVSGAVALFLAQHPQATPQQIRDAMVATGRADIMGAPGGTTNKTVYVGADGDFLSMTLPPFLQYAITANDDIEFDAVVQIGAEGESPYNANILTNGNINLKNMLCRVEGFGYFKNGTDEDEAAVTFAPRYNPMGMQAFFKTEEVVIPEFDATLYQHLATQRTDGDLYLSGHYDLGTEEAPVVWYVDGKLKTSGDVTYAGYGAFIVKDGVELSHGLSEADNVSMLGIYTKNNIKVNREALAGVTMSGQLYGKDVEFESPVSLTGSITATGRVKFKNGVAVTLSYRMPPMVLTELFWSSSSVAGKTSQWQPSLSTGQQAPAGKAPTSIRKLVTRY